MSASYPCSRVATQKHGSLKIWAQNAHSLAGRTKNPRKDRKTEKPQRQDNERADCKVFSITSYWASTTGVSPRPAHAPLALSVCPGRRHITSVPLRVRSLKQCLVGDGVWCGPNPFEPQKAKEHSPRMGWIDRGYIE